MRKVLLCVTALLFAVAVHAQDARPNRSSAPSVSVTSTGPCRLSPLSPEDEPRDANFAVDCGGDLDKYQFSDFFKVGLPLTVLIYGIAIVLVPWFWPI